MAFFDDGSTGEDATLTGGGLVGMAKMRGVTGPNKSSYSKNVANRVPPTA